MNCAELFMLTEKVAIVTGASRGLGREMALALSKAGATIVAVSRTEELIQDLADRIVLEGGQAMAMKADMTDRDDIDRILSRTVDRFHRVDVLINNAGVGPVGPALDIDESQWDQVMDINLKAMFFMAQATAKIMIKQKRGVITNVGSALGILVSPMAAHYCTSKAGVAHMTKALALEWAQYNIRVNCLIPGFMDTEMIKHTQESESQKRFLDFKIPMKRLGQPQELVGAALFLSSEASSYVTGAQLVVDGGYTLW